MKIKLTKKLILTVASFIMLTLQAFGVKFDVPAVNEIISTVLAALVMFGVLTDSGSTNADSENAETPPEDDPDGEKNDTDKNDTDKKD